MEDMKGFSMALRAIAAWFCMVMAFCEAGFDQDAKMMIIYFLVAVVLLGPREIFRFYTQPDEDEDEK